LWLFLFFDFLFFFQLPFFLYRHGVDDYPFLSGLFSASHLGKLNWWIRFNLAVGPRWAAKQVRPLERCEAYTFILSAIESASSRDYDI